MSLPVSDPGSSVFFAGEQVTATVTSAPLEVESCRTAMVSVRIENAAGTLAGTVAIQAEATRGGSNWTPLSLYDASAGAYATTFAIASSTDFNENFDIPETGARRLRVVVTRSSGSSEDPGIYATLSRKFGR